MTGAVGLCTLIGRGWNLFKFNLKPSLILMLIPTILFTFVSILASIPGSTITMTNATADQAFISVIAISVAVLLGIVAWFLSMYACTALTRIYYSALVQEKPLSFRESLRFIRKHCGLLFVVFLGIGLACMIFSFLDIAGFMAGFFAVTAFITYVMAKAAPLSQVGAVIAAILIGFSTLFGVFLLITYQIFLCLFPLVAIATSPGEGVFKAMAHSLRLLFTHSKRALIFGSLLLTLYFLLALILQLPSLFWLAMEFQRLSTQQELTSPGVIPLHLSVASHIWSSLTHIILWGFMFAAITLFWYDCQVSSEGLDIRLALEGFKARKRKTFKGMTS